MIERFDKRAIVEFTSRRRLFRRATSILSIRRIFLKYRTQTFSSPFRLIEDPRYANA